MIFRSAATKLLHASWDIPMLRLEDVFWTGIVAEKAGVTPLGNNGLFHFYQVQPINGCMYSRIISSHLMSTKEIVHVTKDVDRSRNCSNRNIGVNCIWTENIESAGYDGVRDFRKNFICE